MLGKTRERTWRRLQEPSSTTECDDLDSARKETMEMLGMLYSDSANPMERQKEAVNHVPGDLDKS
jgi:hypothetical protein